MAQSRTNDFVTSMLRDNLNQSTSNPNNNNNNNNNTSSINIHVDESMDEHKALLSTSIPSKLIIKLKKNG